MGAQVSGPVDIYARVSQLRDKEQTSTTGQVAVCRAILDERGLPVGEVHIDDGKSAWDPRVWRPGWHKLMERLENGQAAGVIIYDLERFARQLKDGERLVSAAERGIIVLDSEGEYDLRKPGDKKNFRNAIVAAEYYSDLVGAKTRRGKAMKARSGQVDARRSFGFEDDGVTVIDAEAEVIRDHARRLLAGETQAALVAELNEQGPPAIRGGRWGYTTYRQIMTRPRNAGFIVHNGAVVEGVRLPGEPILDETTHARLVALYTARKPGRQPSGRYLLTGLAYCACGAALAGRPVAGTTRRQYWCRPGYVNKVAGPHTIVDMVRLDEWAGDWAISELADPDKATAREAADRERTEARERLLAEHAEIEQTMITIAGRLGRREITLPRHDAICRPLEARLDEIAAALASDDLAVTPAPPRGSRTVADVSSPLAYARLEWLARWDEGNPTEKRALVLQALRGRRIAVGPGKSAKFDPERAAVVA